jgi:predicted Fe-Mo cluster-binding NifX family protein
MKIAIASDDEIHIANHFGRALGFVIFEIEKDVILNKEYRKNIGKHTGECGSCDHDMMIDNIKDCDVVISYGMGRRIFADLSKNNLKAFVTDVDTVDEALKRFIKNELINRLDKLH